MDLRGGGKRLLTEPWDTFRNRGNCLAHRSRFPRMPFGDSLGLFFAAIGERVDVLHRVWPPVPVGNPLYLLVQLLREHAATKRSIELAL